MKYISVDVGGTFIKHALIDETGMIIKQNKVATPLTKQEDFLNCIMKVLNSYSEQIQGIAMSLPGTIDADKGFVYQGGTLRYNAMSNLKELLEKKCNLPVELENDAHCAALAEVWQGNLQGIQNGIVLTFGTGIGGCIILEGKPYKGTHLAAGELSMLLTKDLKSNGLNAVWGPQGSPTKLIQRICSELNVELVDGKTLFQWIEDKNEVATRLFQDYCEGIAQQLLNLQIMFDPQRICIGGGVSANPMFTQAITKTLHGYYDMVETQLPINIPRMEIMTCKFHNESNLIGAFYHFKKQQKL